jgi:hypothetical protein
MPQFHPPLAHTSTIPLPAGETQYPFVNISFLATVAEHENVSDAWEVWTDLPELGKDGIVVSQDGVWRAIPFQAIETSDTATISQVDNRNLPVIHLPAQPQTTPQEKQLVASSIVPFRNGSSYSYTYRHTLSNGDIQWLGDGGNNGVIQLIATSDDARSSQAAWKGVALSLPSSDS